jgi:hypothetical protein
LLVSRASRVDAVARFQLVVEEAGSSQILLFESSQPGEPLLEGQPLLDGETVVFRGRTWHVGEEQTVESPEAPARFRLLPAA